PAYVTWSSTAASATSLGSPVMNPSTSVQIQSSSASRLAATMLAEKSDPPRPRVVGRPSAVAPLNPVTTGTPPPARMGNSRPQHFTAVSSINGDALPNTASVTITSLPLMAAALTPVDFRNSD